MSRHSPDESMFDDEAGPDAQEIRKTLWDTSLDQSLLQSDTSLAKATKTSKLLDVFLRIRPTSSSELAKQKQDKQFMTVLNANEVKVEPPKKSQTFKNKGDSSCRYKFSQICDAETTQEDFFQKTTLPLVHDVLNGKDSLLFTYGVTNAGKTFTIQGVPEDTGILPRSLDVIFNSISGHTANKVSLRPKCFKDVVPLTPGTSDKLSKIKEEILTRDRSLTEDMSRLEDSMDQTNTSSDSIDEGNDETIDEDAETDVNASAIELEIDLLATDERMIDNTTVPIDDSAEYTIFVSYAEVYNECVYDLLAPMPAKAKRRATSRIGEKNGEVYIRGLREVNVVDSNDAIKIICAGQRNRSVASTKSNNESSRSHCLFTIKVIRTSKTEGSSINQLTIVDLAGSERYKKTDATGERIKEAGTINTSLMTLGKCMDALRWNNSHKSNQRLIPIRESKLTRLFKHFLEGKGCTRMIVNVANVNESFDETLHVLKFSALASKVNVPAIMSKIDTGINRLEKEIERGYIEDISDLEEYTCALTEQLNMLKSQLANGQMDSALAEERIREEVAEEMAEQLEQLEEHYQKQITAQTEATENMYQKKLNVFARSVARVPAKSRIAELGLENDSENTQSAQLADAHAEISSLKRQIEELEESKDDVEEMKEEMAQVVESLDEVTLEKQALENTIQKLQDSLQDQVQRYEKLESDSGADLEKLQETHTQILESLKEENSRALTILKHENDSLARADVGISKLVKKHREEMQHIKHTHMVRHAEHVEETESMKENLEDELKQLKRQLNEVLTDNDNLNNDYDTLQSKLALFESRPTQDQYDELKTGYDALKLALEKSQQQTKMANIQLNRKIKAQGENIKTLNKTLFEEEAKTDKLGSQLADVIGEQLESDVEKFAATPVGSKLRNNGGILSEMERSTPSKKSKLSLDTTLDVLASTTSSDTLHSTTIVINESTIDVPTVSNCDDAVVAEVAVAKSKTKPVKETKTKKSKKAAQKAPTKKTSRNRSKRKSVQEESKENEDVEVKNSPVVKKKRKLFAKGRMPSLDTQEVPRVGMLPTKGSQTRVTKLLTPIKRRLRSRTNIH
eukprot:m.174695 g.174695  ORF g.174695 m.174695 type:complete len:1087 (-) comp31780_c0_seq1:653-3913(-)